LEVEVSPDHRIALEVPETVPVGRHKATLTINESDDDEATRLKSQDEALKRFAGVWQNKGVDAVEYQRQIRDEWP